MLFVAVPLPTYMCVDSFPAVIPAPACTTIFPASAAIPTELFPVVIFPELWDMFVFPVA